MRARLFPSTVESLDASCNQTPPLFRLIMDPGGHPGVDERGMHGYGYGQKGETLELKAGYGKHVSYLIQGLEFWRGSVVISRAFLVSVPSEQVRLRTSNRRLKKNLRKVETRKKNGSS